MNFSKDPEGPVGIEQGCREGLTQCSLCTVMIPELLPFSCVVPGAGGAAGNQQTHVLAGGSLSKGPVCPS